MIDLGLVSRLKKIKELTYDTVILERPMSNLVDFDFRNILDPPPANDSKTTKLELEKISRLTSQRTQADIELIYKVDGNIDEIYINALSKSKLDYPQRYIDLFYDIAKPILSNTKSYWNRPRPIQLAKLYDIPINRIVTDTIHTASYPSGHVVYAQLVKNILSELHPKLDNVYTNIVNLVSEARIKQGVHYPSDSKAGIEFANYVFNILQLRLKKYGEF